MTWYCFWLEHNYLVNFLRMTKHFSDVYFIITFMTFTTMTFTINTPRWKPFVHRHTYLSIHLLVLFSFILKGNFCRVKMLQLNFEITALLNDSEMTQEFFVTQKWAILQSYSQLSRLITRLKENSKNVSILWYLKSFWIKR